MSTDCAHALVDEKSSALIDPIVENGPGRAD